MDRIPETLRIKMMIYAISLLNKRNGWDKIHYNIKKSPLYLKKSLYSRYIPRDMLYEIILRANTTVYFVNGKTFTWLKRSKRSGIGRFKSWENVYYYQPSYCKSILDV